MVIGDRDVDGWRWRGVRSTAVGGAIVVVEKACRLVLLAVVVTACEPEVEVESTSDWMLGTFSSNKPGDRTLSLASVGHYEFHEDGTLTWIALTHCEENREEPIQELKWQRAGDSLVIVDPMKPEGGVDQWRIRPGEDCSTLEVDEVVDGQIFPGFTLWRGAVCMQALPPCEDCPSCETVWCDEAPLACEE